MVVAVAAFATPPVWAEPKFPELTGRVVDGAGLLNEADEAAIAADLAALEEKTTDQFVVVTVPSLDGVPIEDYGYQLGRAWGIGQKDKDNGVLLIVAPKDRKLRIEVGRGLEPLLTDLMSKLIIENAIRPAFRRGDFPGGIKEGVRNIKDVLQGDKDAVAARIASGDDEPFDWVAFVVLCIWVTIVVFIIWRAIQSSRQGLGRGRGDDGIVFLPTGNGRGTWDGGNDRGWQGGGGGDFGGGGASGDW